MSHSALALKTHIEARLRWLNLKGNDMRLPCLALLRRLPRVLASLGCVLTLLGPAANGARAAVLDYSGGFTNPTGLTANGSTTFVDSRARLTNTVSQAGSLFSTNRVPISSFVAEFEFQLTSPEADGITFTIQGGSPTALGVNGTSLGYEGIANSAAVKFDIFF